MSNFRNGVYSMGVPILGAGMGLMSGGKHFFINPNVGSDSNSGSKWDLPKDTLAAVLDKMTADKHDVCYFVAGGNAAAEATDYQSSTLTWNKDLCHIIGINAGNMLSQRSRVGFISTYDTASNLFTLSGSGCLVANIQFYEGVAGTNPTGCVLVSGERNHFHNCHFAGIGHDNNDIANAYSLQVSGGENLFTDCVIGLDTISRGTADNSEIVFSGGCARNIFRNCLIITYAGANTHQFIKRAASGSDRFQLFENCTFINSVPGTTMTEAFDITAGGSPAGGLYFKNCSVFGCTDIEAATVSGIVYVHGNAVTAADNSVGGLAAAS